MLNEKQLQDAAKCERNFLNCRYCSCNDDNIPYCLASNESAQTALVYREMLVNHMWHKRSSDGNYFCIECGHRKDIGHDPGCKLAELLGKE